MRRRLPAVTLLRYEPGDTLVVALADQPPDYVLKSLREQLRKKYPECEVLVLCRAELSVLRHGA